MQWHFLNRTDRLEEAKIAVKKSRNTLHDNFTLARIDYTILHPDYHNARLSTFLQNDIAVLRFKQTIILNDRQGVIALPSPDKQVGPETVLKAAGWGYTTPIRAKTNAGLEEERDLPEQLQQAPVKVMALSACRSQWSVTMPITDNMFCINSTETDIGQVWILFPLIGWTASLLDCCLRYRGTVGVRFLKSSRTRWTENSSNGL